MSISSYDLKTYQINAFYMHFIFIISKYYIISQFTEQSGEFFAFQHLAIRHFVCLHPEHTFSVFLINAKPQKQLIS